MIDFLSLNSLRFWAQDHILAISVLILTLVLIYHYLIERDRGAQLSKKYRHSIFEAQSKIFLNATQYLISGNKDLAIKEFLNAVDLNRETIETYFALGRLFRSNGEIEKAISIHRSVIARNNISESTRLMALKELAVDFDKGGFIDKAIETYKDVLKINRDQYEVIQALCRIYEDIEDWEQAYHYRIKLSKVGDDQDVETISHILVQKAKVSFERGAFTECAEELEDAFRFAPSVSAKILRLKIYLIQGNMEDAQILFIELLREHPQFISFVFVDLERGISHPDYKETYKERLKILIDFFLKTRDRELELSPAFCLAKLRVLKEENKFNEAYEIIRDRMNNPETKDKKNEVLKIEYIKLLIQLNKHDEVVTHTSELLQTIQDGFTRHYCKECGHNSDEIFWRCPQCKEWETIQFRWKL